MGVRDQSAAICMKYFPKETAEKLKDEEKNFEETMCTSIAELRAAVENMHKNQRYHEDVQASTAAVKKTPDELKNATAEEKLDVEKRRKNANNLLLEFAGFAQGFVDEKFFERQLHPYT